MSGPYGPRTQVGRIAKKYGVKHDSVRNWDLTRPMDPLALQCLVNEIKRTKRLKAEGRKLRQETRPPRKPPKKVPSEHEMTVEALLRLAGKIKTIRPSL